MREIDRRQAKKIEVMNSLATDAQSRASSIVDDKANKDGQNES